MWVRCVEDQGTYHLYSKEVENEIFFLKNGIPQERVSAKRHEGEKSVLLVTI